MSEPLAYRVDDAAASLGVHKNTVWRLIADHELTTFKLGRCTLIEAGSLRALINRKIDQTRAA